jgi:hypothetical protein
LLKEWGGMTAWKEKKKEEFIYRLSKDAVSTAIEYSL